jgi:hypothetical protein
MRIEATRGNAMTSLFAGRARHCARVGLIVAAGLGLTATANAACYPPDSQLPQPQIQSFLNDPAQLLSKFPTGGGSLVIAVRDLVASDNTTLPAVIKLLGSANPQQRTAIGSALGIAARLCIGPDQAYAGQIQSALAAANDALAMTAFVSASGQVTGTAATGPAGLGGQVNPFSNLGTNPTTVTTVQGRGSTQTNFFTFSGGTSSTSGGGGDGGPGGPGGPGGGGNGPPTKGGGGSKGVSP